MTFWKCKWIIQFPCWKPPVTPFVLRMNLGKILHVFPAHWISRFPSYGTSKPDWVFILAFSIPWTFLESSHTYNPVPLSLTLSRITFLYFSCLMFEIISFWKPSLPLHPKSKSGLRMPQVMLKHPEFILLFHSTDCFAIYLSILRTSYQRGSFPPHWISQHSGRPMNKCCGTKDWIPNDPAEYQNHTLFTSDAQKHWVKIHSIVPWIFTECSLCSNNNARISKFSIGIQ